MALNPRSQRSLVLSAIGSLIFCAMTVGGLRAAFGPNPPQSPAGEGGHRDDQRLYVAITSDFNRPRIDDILRELTKTTKVNLSRGEGINNDQVIYTTMTLRQVPAWHVMDNLAASKRVAGRWEADGSGYRLVRNENTLPNVEAAKIEIQSAPPRNGHVLLYSLIGIAQVLALLVGLFWWLRRTKLKATPLKT